MCCFSRGFPLATHRGRGLVGGYVLSPPEPRVGRSEILQIRAVGLKLWCSIILRENFTYLKPILPHTIFTAKRSFPWTMIPWGGWVLPGSLKVVLHNCFQAAWALPCWLRAAWQRMSLICAAVAMATGLRFFRAWTAWHWGSPQSHAPGGAGWIGEAEGATSPPAPRFA